MKIFNIFQIVRTHEDSKNINLLGWAEACRKYPHIHAEQELSHKGSDGFTPDMYPHFKRVGEIGAEDLDHVFEIGNGYNSRNCGGAKWIERNHSISVGDIIERDGRWVMVDGCGFSDIPAPLLKQMVLQWIVDITPLRETNGDEALKADRQSEIEWLQIL